MNTVTFSAGDTILFEGGQTFNGMLTFDNESGTSSSPITIGSYGTGRATINGGNGNGVYIHNVAGFSISNINVVGSGSTTNTTHGIYMLNDLAGGVKLNYIRIDRVDVSKFGLYGVYVEGKNSTSGFSDVRITSTVSHDNADGGIGTMAPTSYVHQNVYVGYSEAYNNKGIPNLTRNTGNGIVLGRVDGGTIEYSTAHDNGGLDTASEGPVGIWAWEANNTIIQYNEAYRNHTGGSHDGDGFDFDQDTKNSIMQYNYAHDNDGAGFLLSDGTNNTTFDNVTIRYNISQNDGRVKYHYGGLHVFGYVNNVEPYNNTIYVTPATGADPSAVALYDWKGSNVHFRNNIFVTTSGTPLIRNELQSGTGLLFQGNDYWTSGGAFQMLWGNATYTSLSAFRSGAAQEKNGATNTGLNVDPLLTNPGNGGTIANPNTMSSLSAYKLQSTSPMIDAGLNLSSLRARWRQRQRSLGAGR